MVCIDWTKDDRLTFVREGENLAMPARKSLMLLRAAQAKSGKAWKRRYGGAPEPAPRMAR